MTTDNYGPARGHGAEVEDDSELLHPAPSNYSSDGPATLGVLSATPRDARAEFFDLLLGHDDHYGTYDVNRAEADPASGKVEIKTAARTVHGTGTRVTREMYDRHLDGTRPLGITPVRADGTTIWGAIDIDDYTLVPTSVIATIRRHDLPLLPVRSKSGGMHLYVFLTAPTEASVVRRVLSGMREAIGYPAAEVFPKQDRIEPGKCGSWLNLPYLDAERAVSYAYKDTGLRMTLGEFTRAAARAAIAPEALAALGSARTSGEASGAPRSGRRAPAPAMPAGALPEFADGPPCMQRLSAIGIGKGSRNEGLHALAIFAKRKFGDDWEARVEEWNRSFVSPPLPSSEVLPILKTVRQKDYNYPCKKEPILGVCDSAACRTRRFGVGDGAERYPHIAEIVILTDGDQAGAATVLWRVTLVGHEARPMALPVREVTDYRTFNIRCAEVLATVFDRLKEDEWSGMVRTALAGARREAVPAEETEFGKFSELLEKFLVNFFTGDAPDDLLGGRPYRDRAKRRLYFRMSDLEDPLRRGDLRLSRSAIGAYIRRLGGVRTTLRVRGRTENAYWVPDVYEVPSQGPLPPLPEKPL